MFYTSDKNNGIFEVEFIDEVYLGPYSTMLLESELVARHVISQAMTMGLCFYLSFSIDVYCRLM